MGVQNPNLLLLNIDLQSKPVYELVSTQKLKRLITSKHSILCDLWKKGSHCRWAAKAKRPQYLLHRRYKRMIL